jgi:ubiquitin-protein ligase
MNKEVEYLIVAPDGDARPIALPEQFGKVCRDAPSWLVQSMGLPVLRGKNWRLCPSSAGAAPALALTCSLSAGASNTSSDPRQVRLEDEYERLKKLNQESDYVRVKELNMLEGSAPEHYLVIFLCRGMVGIDSAQQPIYGERHEVEIYCDIEFPSEPPQLRWVTPSWHPNIDHKTGAVCINKPEWLGGMRIDDLCRMMFEMVQYKNYHVHQVKPWPLDQVVAEWVREYAEPNGIVDKSRGIFVDDKPFIRPTVTDIRLKKKEPPSIKVISAPAEPQPTTAAASPAQLKIKLVNAGGQQQQQSQPNAPGASVGRIKIIGKSD